jgi:NTE family protein
MKQKVALVLGSGGARGIAHIGVIRALIHQGFEISSIAGTSMGAVIGGVYAAGKLDEYENWMRSLSKLDVFNLVDFTMSTQGIIKADRVLKEIKKIVPDQNIEELPVRFAAVATDILKREEVVMTEGSLFEAIRASISIPLVITPARKNETLFVDGGILNPVPVNRVFRQPGDILVAVNVNAFLPYEKPAESPHESSHFEQLYSGKLFDFHAKLEKLFPPSKKESTGYFNLIRDSSSIMLAQITRLTLEMHPPDIYMEISRHSCGIFDFYKTQEMIELGEKVALESLKNWKV